MKSTFLLIILASVYSVAAPGPGQEQTPVETYQAVNIDRRGNLRIRISGGRTVTVPRTGTPRAGESFGPQKAFKDPVVSNDRRAVGAQAMFGNCCTSYDIPLQLVIYSRGKTHRFEGLPIFDWHFVDGGRRVAFSQQPVHFGCFVEWELRDVATERLLAEARIPESCAQAPDPPKVSRPRWVTGSTSGLP